MEIQKEHIWVSPLRLLLFIIFLPFAFAGRPGWERKEVNWPGHGGSQVKAILYPKEKPPHLLPQAISSANSALGTEQKDTESQQKVYYQSPSLKTIATIDSPPIGGFISWCALAVTNARSGEDEYEAVPADSVVGRYLTSTPQTDYAIAVFDTGAGFHLIGPSGADSVGIFDYTPELITSNTTEFAGLTGSATAWVSYPIGLFIGGLSVIDHNGLLSDDSILVGETNVSVAIADPVEAPDSPTAVGTPLSVYLATVFHNDHPIAFNHNGESFTAPDINFYPLGDSHVPKYSNRIPLELRPSGAAAVQYIPNIFDIENFDEPLTPSIVSDFWLHQCLFFLSSVDVGHQGRTAFDKSGFIFDTGSSYTLISQAIGDRLYLNPSAPDFELEVRIATGEIILLPGYYINSLEIVATPQWLSFTNVPVIVFDAPSPEGGTLDGIIGTNLFVNLNFVLHGGGLPGQNLPYIEFESIPRSIVADIAPGAGDSKVNLLDLAALTQVWLTNSESFNWNPRADIAPQQKLDGVVNLFDFALFAQYWRQIQVQ
jgi:hypothetical protein